MTRARRREDGMRAMCRPSSKASSTRGPNLCRSLSLVAAEGRSRGVRDQKKITKTATHGSFVVIWSLVGEQNVPKKCRTKAYFGQHLPDLKQ